MAELPKGKTATCGAWKEMHVGWFCRATPVPARQQLTRAVKQLRDQKTIADAEAICPIVGAYSIGFK